MQCLLLSIFHLKFFLFDCSISHVVEFYEKIDKLFPFTKSNLCKNSLIHLRYFQTFHLFVLHTGKVKEKVKTERINNWISAQSLHLRLMSFNVTSLHFSLKQLINYCCCRVCTILWMIIKKCLSIEAFCGQLFMRYAHCKPLFPFQNTA